MTEALYCRQCGTKISAESKYCRSCGAEQSAPVQSDEEKEAKEGIDDTVPTSTVSTSRQDASNEGAGKKKWVWTGLTVVGVLGLCLSFLNGLSNIFTEKGTEKHPSVTFSNQYGSGTGFEVQWKKKVSISSIAHTSDYEGGILYVSSDKFSLTALEWIDGEQKWKYESREPITTPPVVKDEMIYVGTDQGITAHSEDKGNVNWRFQAGETASIQPLVKKGVVYLATRSGSLYALNAESGAKNWHVEVGDGSISSLAVSVPLFKSDRKIVFAAQGKTVAALDGSTGKWKWAQRIESGTVTALAANGHSAVYAGVSGVSLAASGSGDLYSFDAKSGDKNWHRIKKDCSDPPIGCDIHRLFYSSDILSIQSENKISSIEYGELKNNRRARKKWAYSNTATQNGAEPIFIESNKGAITPDVDAIHSFNTIDGGDKWSIYIDNSGVVNPLVGNAIVYAVTEDKIYAIDGIF